MTLSGAERSFVLTGVCAVPADAQAVAVNVTVTQPTVAGNLKLYPMGSPVPATSTLNFAPGQTRANNAIVLLGGGAITVRNEAGGPTHLILDVNGFFR